MNGILVVLEHGGAWNRMSWEALAAGHKLASELKQPLMAAVAQGTARAAPPTGPQGGCRCRQNPVCGGG